MCKLKSGIILKDSVFVPDYDSHTNMLEELKIKDTRKNAERLFVRAEFYPKEDIFSDVNKWIYHVDQDILPEWYVEEIDKDRFIKAVKEWHKKHILVGVDGITLSDGGTYYIKNCKNVTVKNGSTVNAYDNSTVYAYGTSTVYAYGNSTVYAYDNSTVVIAAFSSNRKDDIKLSDNATLKDCKTKTIYQSGDWKFEKV